MADDEAREEQAAELEALEAIFGDDDFQLLDSEGDGSARFQVELTDDSDPDIRVRLLFTHTARYPHESIRVVAHPLSGVSAPGRRALQSHLEEVARNSVDMPAAYTLCEATRDWLTEHHGGGSNGLDEDEKDNDRKFETLDSTQTEKVEVVSAKAIGTPVTEESFAVWKFKFLDEMDKLKSEEQKQRELSTKLTGRQLFESKAVVVTAESASFWESEASQFEGAA